MAYHHFPSCSQQAWEAVDRRYRKRWSILLLKNCLVPNQPPADSSQPPVIWTPGPEDDIGNHEVPLYCKGCYVWFFKTSSQCELPGATHAMTGTNSEIWAGPYGGSLGFFAERILYSCSTVISYFLDSITLT